MFLEDSMFATKSISRTLSCFLVLIFLSMGAIPAQAESLASPLYASGDFLWAKSMGGDNSEYGMDIATDMSGNIYTTGHFKSTADFDPGAGIFNLTGAGDNSSFFDCKMDVFVSKLDSSGNFIWAKRMGGTDNDGGTSITVDSNGNVYITGSFMGTADFDPASGTFDLTSAGGPDIFISKLDSDGNFIWAKSIGGTDYDESNGIAIDSNGNIYITGYFIGTVDFDPGIGTFNMTGAGSNDIFVSKLDSNGNFVWAKQMGGAGNDISYGIALDSSDNIYTTGYFQLTADFDPGAGIFNMTHAGNGDIFVSKLDSNGNFVWAKSMGGVTSSEQGKSIAVDSSGSVYTTGFFYAWSGTVDFDPGVGVANLTSAGEYDTFISKLDSNGNFAWAKRIGGSLYDQGYGIAVDTSGNVYTTGYFSYETVDFDPGTSVANLTNAGSSDIFISKLDNNGNFVWAKAMGGTGGDISKSIVVSTSGDSIYTTGAYDYTADFDPGAGIANLTPVGSNDIFVSKLGYVDTTPPEINVKGNDLHIINGDTTPSTTDHTDFSDTNITSGTVDRTFTIENTGNSNLILSGTPKVVIGGTNAEDFSVTALPTSPVTTGGSTTFTVRFDPLAKGMRSATVSIDNNDSDENPYNFSIQGTGTIPELTVTKTADTNDGICDSDCSLREAINAANTLNGSNTIIFDDTLGTVSIALTSSLPSITDTSGLTIDGGADVTVDGNNLYRVFYVNSNVSLTLNNITIARGYISGDRGGGVYNNDGNLTIINSTFSGNKSSLGGGGIYNTSNGSLTVIRSTFSSNETAGGGGGIQNLGVMTVKNSTFYGNHASSGGGGIFNYYSGKIYNSTFSDNTDPNGGGVWNSGDLWLYNTIIANSGLGKDCYLYNLNSRIFGNNNLIEGSGSNACNLANAVNGNIIGTDPNLGTLTGSPAYFSIDASSPAFNAGDNSTCESTDQRGSTRPQGTRCDIGAFEFGAPPAAVLTAPIGNIEKDYNPNYAWNNVETATRYRLYVSGPKGLVLDQWFEAAKVCDETTCSVTPGPTYTLGGGAHAWYVQTYNSAGYGPWSNTDANGVAQPTVFNTTVPAAPAAAILSAPKGDIGTNYTPAFTWGAVDTATYYRLYVSGPGGVALDQWYKSADICDATTCSTPSPALTGGAYVWYVQTYNSAGYGPWSNTDANGVVQPTHFNTAATLPSAAVLTEPIGNIGTNFYPAFKWDEVDTATDYRLYVSGPGGVVLDQWYKASDICPDSTCSVPSPRLGVGAHVWYVQTHSPAGYGPWSNTDANGVVQPTHFNTTAPALPVAAVLTEPKNDIGADYNPDFIWNKVDDALYYRLYVSGPAGLVLDKWYEALGICDATTCTVPGPQLTGGAHVWYVQTWNPAGYGPWSNTDANGVVQPTHFNTAATLPVAAVLTAPKGDLGTDYTPAYTWDKVTGAASYRLYVSGPGGVIVDQWYKAADICPTSACSVASPTLAGGAYVWYVQTYNPAGYGPWSNTDANGVVQPTHFNTTIPAVPVAAVLTEPIGSIGTDYNPSYKWGRVATATYYRLYVSGPTGVLLDKWYQATNICDATTCSVLSPTLAGGAHVWYVQTYNQSGYGPWSNTDANGVVQPTNFSTTLPALPAAAVLTAPSGTIASTSTTYTWNRVDMAIWYRLYVKGPYGLVLDQWYQAVDICNPTTCAVPGSSLARGDHTWWVQTYSSAGYGPWRNASFKVSP